LGNDGADVLYWLTPAGAVVRTSAAPPPPPSRGVQAISLCPTSFCLALASFSVLVFSLVVGVAIGLSGPAVTGTSLIGFARAPHDPGEFLSRRGFRGGDGFSLALPILVMYMCLPILLPAFLKLTFFVASRCRLRPATPSSLGFARWPGRIKPPSGHPHPPSMRYRDPRLLERDKWTSAFSSRRNYSWSNLVSATKRCAPPWLLSTLLVEWMIVTLMDLGAFHLNYRTTTAGDVPGARITSDFLRGTWRGGWCALRRATLAVLWQCGEGHEQASAMSDDRRTPH
jgi:hypothetical protein